MDAEKLVNVIELIGQLKQKQDEAQATLNKLVFAMAWQHLKDNEVTLTIHDWAETEDALKQLLGLKPAWRGYVHRNTKLSRPTHIRTFDLKPVRIKLSPATGFYLVRAIGEARVIETLGALDVAERYIDLPGEEK